MTGWIKIHRKLLNWEWYEDKNTFRLFMHLLLKANHKEASWRGKTIHPGQLITSRNQLSRETGLSDQEIRTSLKNLRSTNEISNQSTSQYSLVTLMNYGLYQNINQPSTSHQPATNQPNRQPSTSQTANHQPAINQPEATAHKGCDDFATPNQPTNQPANHPPNQPAIQPLSKKVRSKEVKKDKKTNTKKDSLDYSDWPEAPTEEILQEWLSTRKTLRAVNSQVAINTIGNELKKSVTQGFTVDECLSECITRGWKGFKADWMHRNVKPHPTVLNQNREKRQQEADDWARGKETNSFTFGQTIEGEVTNREEL